MNMNKNEQYFNNLYEELVSLETNISFYCISDKRKKKIKKKIKKIKDQMEILGYED